MDPMRHLSLAILILLPPACDDPGSDSGGTANKPPKELAAQLELCDDADLAVAADCADDILAGVVEDDDGDDGQDGRRSGLAEANTIVSTDSGTMPRSSTKDTPPAPGLLLSLP